MKKMSFWKMETKMNLIGEGNNIFKSRLHVTICPINYSLENKSFGPVTLRNPTDYISWRGESHISAL